MSVRLSWRTFIDTLALAGLATVCVLGLFIFLMDPYGVRVKAGDTPGPVIDLNQRYMYPRLVRSHAYDSAVFGTSTVRLIDPLRLNTLFGGRFANLAMNAATPWEQMQLARLFLHEMPVPRTLVFALDTTWCETDADKPAKRLTFRAFPPWLYDDDPKNDVAGHVSLTTLEIASRLALFRLGRMKERIRADGYEVFTPPENTYDLARARRHIWGDNGKPDEFDKITMPMPLPLTDAQRTSLVFPALGWLEDIISSAPPETNIVIIFPPVHVAAQPRSGTRQAGMDTACKMHVVQQLARRARILDFRFANAVTRNDENYWDPLHTRLPIADKLAQAIFEGASGKTSNDGFYRQLYLSPMIEQR